MNNLDRKNLINKLDRLTHSQLTRVVNLIPGASRNDVPLQEKSMRVQKLVEFVLSPIGPGLEWLSEIVEKVLGDELITDQIESKQKMSFSPPPTNKLKFVGRVAQQAELMSYLIADNLSNTSSNTGENRVHITGGSGIGKSALTKHVIAQEEVRTKFSKRIIWLDLDDVSTIKDFNAQLDEAVGLRNNAAFKALQSSKKPTLLVIDSPEKVITYDSIGFFNHLDNLCKSQQLALVINCQGRDPFPEPWKTVKLGLLEVKTSEEDLAIARNIFTNITSGLYAGSDMQHDVNAILHEVDGLPIAIVLLAEAVKEKNVRLEKFGEPKLKPTDILREIQNKGGTQFLTQSYPLISRQQSLSVVVAYSLDGVDSDCRQFFRVLSRMPAGLPLNDLMELNAADWRDSSLIKLIDLGLVLKELQRERKHFQVLKLVQQLVSEGIPGAITDTAQDLEKELMDLAEGVVFNFYERRVQAMDILWSPEAASKIASEAANIEAILTRALDGPHELAALRCLAKLHNFIQLSGMVSKEVVLKARDRAKELGESNLAAQLAICYFCCIRYKQPLDELFSEVVAMYRIARRSTEVSTRNTGTKVLSDYFLQKENYARAGRYLDKAESGYREVNNTHGLANCEFSRGLSYYLNRRYDKASHHLQEAIRLHSLPENNDQQGIANCTRVLGELYEHCGRYADAVSNFSEALAIYDKMNSQMGRLNCRRDLAHIALLHGEIPESERYMVEVEEIAEINNFAEATSSTIKFRGIVALCKNDFLEADIKLNSALKSYKIVGQPMGNADCLRLLGVSALMQKKFEEARSNLDEALSIYEDINDKDGIMRCYAYQGIAYSSENFDDAISKLKLAKRWFVDNKSPFFSGIMSYFLSFVVTDQDKQDEYRKEAELAWKGVLNTDRIAFYMTSAEMHLFPETA